MIAENRDEIQDIDLRKINFGRSTAESELYELNNYFVTTPSYLNAINEASRKIFYIGHRGSGKSALFNHLAFGLKELNKNILVFIEPTEYSYDIFKKIEHNFYDMKTIYGVVWKYTLLIAAYKSVLNFFEKNKHIKKHKENLQSIKKYLKENGLLEVEGGINLFLKFFKKFSISKVGLKISQFEISAENNNNGMQDETKLLKLLNMQDILKSLNAFRLIINTYPVYYFIDELDTGWDNSKEAHNFLYGLFYAINKLKREKNLNIFLSLRVDMYNNLPIVYTDAEKLRDDIEFITWNKQNLKALIGRRIINSLSKDKQKSIGINKALQLVFENDVLDYIIEHTLYRPRGVIQYCNDVLNIFKKANMYNITHKGLITLEMAKFIENHFSNNRLKELCAEYRYQFPDLYKFLLLFENSKEFYDYIEFREKLELVVLQFSELSNSIHWINEYIDKLDEFIKILFDIGFIKIYVPRLKRFAAYYEIEFYFISNITKLKIHELFCSALKINQNA